MPWLVDLAVRSGPWTAWVLPSIALTLGLVIAWRVVREWTERHSTSATHDTLTALDEGRRVRLRGRLARERGEHDAAEGYVLRTATERVPVLGKLELGSSLDVEVLVEGFVGRVMRPAIREQAGVLALRDHQDGRFFEPIRVRRSAPSRSARALLGATMIGLTVLVATQLAWPFLSHGVPVRASLANDVHTVARLASPTREDTLHVIAFDERTPDPLYRRVAARRAFDPVYLADRDVPALRHNAIVAPHLLRAQLLAATEIARREAEAEALALALLKVDADFPRFCLDEGASGCPTSACERYSHDDAPPPGRVCRRRPRRPAAARPRGRGCILRIDARRRRRTICVRSLGSSRLLSRASHHTDSTRHRRRTRL